MYATLHQRIFQRLWVVVAVVATAVVAVATTSVVTAATVAVATNRLPIKEEGRVLYRTRPIFLEFVTNSPIYTQPLHHNDRQIAHHRWSTTTH